MINKILKVSVTSKKFLSILKVQNAELLENQILKPRFNKVEKRLYSYDVVQKLAELVKIPLNVGSL